MRNNVWVIDPTDLQRYYDGALDRPRPERIREYYRGFGPRRDMFEEELKDLEKVYANTSKDILRKIENCMPHLIFYMEEFTGLHKQSEAIKEKLESLRAKICLEECEDER